MNLVEDFDNVSTDEHGHIVITEKEIADLRYSFIDDDGEELLIPLRWHTFGEHDGTIIIQAATDHLPGAIIGMSVFFNYFTWVTRVEMVDENSVGHYADWHMKLDMRADLWQAVKTLAWRMYDIGVVREWPSGTNPAEWMETL